ncbi:MAG: hypothetical protein QOG52_308 [Frankiaceae bacterium]|nr:hypothetical protein [Frankiaceae bacterium]MDQ1714067.1 hypothetical protein [Frankiaceae bacterium]MDQ1723280.1 hypothetical protein [Frankiaceae bacterium]
MLVGDALSAEQIDQIGRTLQRANRETGLHFSVFLGDPIDGSAPRDFAVHAHAALGDALARKAVLILVAPSARRVEIVTGSEVNHRVNDRACGLAALSMSGNFAGGDLPGGIVTGIRMLADSAGQGSRARVRVGR